ncbi:hypothetical protein BCR42DRAFT_404505 [Absidia repens]|uniref:Hydrophobic surface binding protein A-domain-containing protein n=1 Tax=Absidia repens TaxID=90262 RepID=A0A1X2IW91_9FUNG|nr:hypothetical protein BCR42DRAFT_404505 [Absidia repens]
MQLKLASLLFFVLALCAYTTSALPSAHPIDVDVSLKERDIETISFAEHLSGDLAKRTIFPINTDAKLTAKIMVAIKAKVKADVVAKMSASVSEKMKASFDIKVKVLGGLISLGDARISARQSAAINKAQGKVSASIEANLETEVYAPIEAELNKLLKKKKKVSQADLMKILTNVEAKLIAKLKIKLPEICAKLKASIQASVEACIKDLAINIPLILTIKINSASRSMLLSRPACADLNAKATRRRY